MNTGNTGQDMFNPNQITVNQGDNISVTFEDNDTDGHTFEILLPQGLYILNNSLPGETNHLTLATFATPPDNCQIASTVIPCNTVGNCNSDFSACNVTSTVSFVVTQPGIYRFFCLYHQALGMYGFLIVLPNRAYMPTNSTSTGS
jgi:plastocyanin